MNRTRILAAFALLACTAARAELYTGALVDIIDKIAADQQQIIGIDPAILEDVHDRQISVEIDNDWLAPVRSAMDVIGLQLSEHDQRWLITDPVAADLALAVEAMGEGDFDAGSVALKRGLAAAPDDARLLKLSAMTTRLPPLQTAYHEQLDRLRPLLTATKVDAEHVRKTAGALAECADAWQALATASWGYYFEISRVGGSAAAWPVFAILQQEEAKLASMLRAVRERGYEADLPGALATRTGRSDFFAGLLLYLQSRTDKSRQLRERGDACLARGRTEQAQRLYEHAVDLHHENLEARASLAWIQAERRQAERREVGDGSATDLPAAEQAARFAAWAAQRKSSADSSERRVWQRFARQYGLPVAVQPEPASHAGPALGSGFAVSLSGGASPYVGNSMIMIEVSLEPRTMPEVYYELDIVCHWPIDSELSEALYQSLTWLNADSGDKLSGYRITVKLSGQAEDLYADSIGAAVAVAGFSAMYERPVAGDTAILGEVRADGNVGRVRGCVAKVRKAISAGKSVIIVPQANAADLYRLSPAERREARIILVDDIADILPVAIVGAPYRQSAWERAHELYVAAGLFETIGMLSEALAAYRQVQAAINGDYCSTRAITRLSAAGVAAAALPAWLTAGSDAAVALQADSGSTTPGNARLQRTSTLLAELAAKLSREQHPHGRQLADLSLMIDPDNVAGRLLKGRLHAKRPIPEDTAGSENFAELAALLNQMADLAFAATDPRQRNVALMCNLIVLEHLDADDPDSLVGLAGWPDPASRQLTPLLTDVLANGLTTAPAARPNSHQPTALQAKSVPALRQRRASLPENGLWPAIARNADSRREVAIGSRSVDALSGWWYLTLNSNCSGKYRVDFTGDYWFGEDFDLATVTITPGQRQRVDVDGTQYELTLSGDCENLVLRQRNNGGTRSSVYTRDPVIRARYNGIYKWQNRIEANYHGYVIVRALYERELKD